MYSTGTLYIVATPIGNLGDLSGRALKILKEVKIVAAEDTRVSQKLLTLASSGAKLLSYHKFNENKTVEYLIECLKNGSDVAVISDAGTPLISDPGYILVQRAHKEMIPVNAVPGPSAVISACSISGMDCSNFVFLGFLPKSENETADLLHSVADFKGAVVFFEAPHRLLRTFNFLKTILSPLTQACLCKEITKKFEKTLRGTLEEAVSVLENTEIQGEWTCLLEKLIFREKAFNTAEKSIEEVSKYFDVNRSKAAKILSIITGKAKKDIY